jgi:diguanylate cyclase (GGDEF)-like protein
MAVAENLEMGQAVNHILDQLKQVVPYDSASVQLIEGNELVIVGGRGWEDEADVLGMRFPVPGENPNSAVIQTGKPYYLADAGKVYEKFSEPPHDHIRSWLGVPLIVQGRLTGLLAIDSAQPGNFDEEKINIALEFANQVAGALENARLFRESQTQAITDALTGVYNRRGLFQLGEFEFQRSRRINRPFSVMMFDIDHFKQVNDKYGHAAGDQVLHQVAQRCLKNSRATDLVGRYGGEEFVMLLTETNLHAAHAIAERLRLGIMKSSFHTDAGEISITLSIGVAEAGKTDTLEALIERADAALYQAKHTGRNRVVASD